MKIYGQSSEKSMCFWSKAEHTVCQPETYA